MYAMSLLWFQCSLIKGSGCNFRKTTFDHSRRNCGHQRNVCDTRSFFMENTQVDQLISPFIIGIPGLEESFVLKLSPKKYLID